MPDVASHLLGQPERLDAVRRVLTLSRSGDDALARISRLATALLRTPVSLVSIVDDDRQVFRGQTGLDGPFADGTPLSHSFCQHVVAGDAPLVITDARDDARVSDNEAIEDLHVVAYCGVPLRTPEGLVLGSFCVIDRDPRAWTAEEVALVEDLAAIAANELAVRLRGGLEETALAAHDMRTAVHGLLGGFRTLAAAPALERRDRARFVAMVERHARELTAALDQLVEGPAALAAHVVDVDAQGMLVEVAAEREVAGQPSVDVQEGPPQHGRAVPSVLRRILAELVDHVTSDGARAMACVEAADDHVELLVAAAPEPGLTGAIGTAPGRGMAFAAARDLARAMGGDAALRATASGGMAFVVRLPAA